MDECLATTREIDFLEVISSMGSFPQSAETLVCEVLDYIGDGIRHIGDVHVGSSADD